MDERTANLLGVVALAVAEGIEGVSRQVLNRTGESAAALVVIGYNRGPSNDELRKILGLSHSGTVRLIDRLVDDGLVERRQGRDGREIALFVSKRGRNLREKILKKRLAAISPYVEPLSGAEKKALTKLLSKMLSAMEPSDLKRQSLCRLCDTRVCTECPIPAEFRRST